MKILYDGQIFRQQRYGGISRYFCEIASRIDKMDGTTATIVAPRHTNSFVSKLPLGTMVGWPVFNRGDMLQRRLQQWIETVAAPKWAPNIVHETYYWGPTIESTSAVRVLTIYDMIHERFGQLFGANDPTADAKRQTANRADHIICISESTRRDVIDILGVAPSKVSVTHLAASLKQPQHGVAPSEPLPTDFVLYVGERGGYKNFATFLLAMASPRLHDLSVVCFGGGPFSEHEWQLADRFGIERERICLRQGSDDTLAQLYSHARCFVYPSLFEGFGLPLLEAMQCSCPVVCSNISSLPEVAGNAAAYFDPREFEDIRCALERVVESPSLANDLRAKGRQRVAMFSWDRCAAETAAIYRTLVHS